MIWKKNRTTPFSSFGSLTLNGNATFTPQDTITITANLNADAGTLAGTQNISVAGSVSGNGDINLTGGTLTLSSVGVFQSDTNWDFNNLTVGNTATTYGLGAGTVTLAGQLTIGVNASLYAGATKNWRFASATTPISFGASGTFYAESSKASYISPTGVN